MRFIKLYNKALTTTELINKYNNYYKPTVPLTIENVENDYLDEYGLGYFAMYILPSLRYEENKKKREKREENNKLKKNTNYIICWKDKEKIGQIENYKLLRTCSKKDINSLSYNHLSTLLHEKRFSDYQIVVTGRNMHTVDMLFLDFDINSNNYLKPTYNSLIEAGLNLNGYIISRPWSSDPHFQFFINLDRFLDLDKEDDRILFQFIMTTFKRMFKDIDENAQSRQARNPGCEINQKVKVFTEDKMSLNVLLALLYDWNIDNCIEMPQRVHELINGHPLTKPCTLNEFLDKNKDIKVDEVKKKSPTNKPKKPTVILNSNSLNYKKLKDHPYLADLLKKEIEIYNYIGKKCPDIIDRLHFYCNDYSIDSRNESAYFNSKYFLRDLEIDGYEPNHHLTSLVYTYYEYYSLPFTSKTEIESDKKMKASIKGVLPRAIKAAEDWKGDKSFYLQAKSSSKFTPEQREKGQKKERFNSDLGNLKIQYRLKIKKETWAEVSSDFCKAKISRAMNLDTYVLVNRVIDYIQEAILTYKNTNDIALKIYLFDNIIAVAMSFATIIESLIGYIPQIFKEIEDILCNTGNDLNASSNEVKEEIIDILNVSMNIFKDFVDKIYTIGELIDVDALIQEKINSNLDLKLVC